MYGTVCEVLSGAFRGVWLLLVAGIGYSLFAFSRHVVEDEHKPVMPKWKAALVVPMLAAFLGLLASGDYQERGCGDGIYAGEVVDYEENQHPVRSFMCVFVFASIAMWMGIAKAIPPLPSAETRSNTSDHEECP